MGRIRSKNTKPEKLVRSLLHGMGYRFRLHKKDLPGKPDIVLPKYRTVLLVHGCFWHRHPGCKYSYTPKTRKKFWETKFEKNVERDRTNIDALKKLGWNVEIIWECQTHNLEYLTERINKLLTITLAEDSSNKDHRK